MGNESSVEMVEKGVKLQAQGEEHLWTLCLERGPKGEGEGACIFSRRPGKGSHADLCRTAVEHLRLLRHPNIIKFLGSDLSDDRIILYTEPIVPVLNTLEAGSSTEGVVMGWRGVASGLQFLHEKACLSHNNVSANCVYVNVLDSQWKLGGLETAARQPTINSAFFSKISSIRHESATPPEDKSDGKPVPSQPIHCRDVWAFGQFILTILEEAGLEAQFSNALFQYVNDEMLNPDPQLRPTISEILTQPWMSNKSSQITEFLSKLTLKQKAEKDEFFRGIAQDLFSLPPSVLAEHVVPLLISPLVMSEPVARDSLWKHLLLPVSTQNPRREVFEDSLPCPLLQEDLFKSHVIPVLLNLLESRDQHVRLTLLAHLRGYAPLCDSDELVCVVLPEVLMGLKDSSDQVVGATLRALGDLVPLLGGDVVMGTSRKHIFTDAQPRTSSPECHEEKKTGHQPKASPPRSARKNTPPLSRPAPGTGRSKEERMREMKEKRERQRLKRMAQNKLGHVALPAGSLDAEAGTVAPPTLPSPQYSPSISHDDEVEGEGLGGSGTSIEGVSKVVEQDEGSEDSEEMGVAWEGFDETKEDGGGGSGDEWGGAWSDVDQTGEQEEEQVAKVTMPRPQQHKGHKQESLPLSTSAESGGVAPQQGVRPGGMSLKGKLKLGGGKEAKGSQDKKGAGSPGDPPSSSSNPLRGRLKAEDIERLEEQSRQSQYELDLFADMAPKIASTSSSLFPVSSGTAAAGGGGGGAVTPDKTTPTISKSFAYQPEQDQEPTSGDWGSEDWNENF